MYDLAICAIFQNESPYLAEWLEFHAIVGVQHFFLYDHLSTDNPSIVLNPYLHRGDVTLIPWSYPTLDHPEWDALQRRAYEDAVQRTQDKTRWLAFLDIDEFLFPVQEDNLVDFLRSYEGVSGVCVNWQMYGTSKMTTIPAGRLLIESLLLKAPTDYDENRLFKSIVKPSDVLSCKNPHLFTYRPGSFQVNPNGEPFVGSRAPYVAVDKVRVNHYWSKDEAYFFKVKAPRRKKWGEGAATMLTRIQSLNQVEDGAILRFVPALRRRMGMA